MSYISSISLESYTPELCAQSSVTVNREVNTEDLGSIIVPCLLFSFSSFSCIYSFFFFPVHFCRQLSISQRQHELTKSITSFFQNFKAEANSVHIALNTGLLSISTCFCHETFLLSDSLIRNVIFFMDICHLTVTLSRFQVAESILLTAQSHCCTVPRARELGRMCSGKVLIFSYGILESQVIVEDNV